MKKKRIFLNPWRGLLPWLEKQNGKGRHLCALRGITYEFDEGEGKAWELVFIGARPPSSVDHFVEKLEKEGRACFLSSLNQVKLAIGRRPAAYPKESERIARSLNDRYRPELLLYEKKEGEAPFALSAEERRRECAALRRTQLFSALILLALSIYAGIAAYGKYALPGRILVPGLPLSAAVYYFYLAFLYRKLGRDAGGGDKRKGR